MPVISGMGILRLRGNSGNRMLPKFDCFTVVHHGNEIEPQTVRNKLHSTHKHEPISVAEFPSGSEMIGHPFW
jgi:hypothetical protein